MIERRAQMRRRVSGQNEEKPERDAVSAQALQISLNPGFRASTGFAYTDARNKVPMSTWSLYQWKGFSELSMRVA